MRQSLWNANRELHPRSGLEVLKGHQIAHENDIQKTDWNDPVDLALPSASERLAKAGRFPWVETWLKSGLNAYAPFAFGAKTVPNSP